MFDFVYYFSDSILKFVLKHCVTRAGGVAHWNW